MCAIPLDLRNCSARAKEKKARWPCEIAHSGVSVVQQKPTNSLFTAGN